MKERKRHDEVSIEIAAPPERVYELVADITRMGDWSPECYHCEWTKGATGPAVGARFKAKNKGMPMGDIRALGAMCAFELVTERGGDKPDAAATKALVAKCLERGLLILSCGVYGDTIRLLTPLTASEAILKEGLDILESAILGN